MAVHYPRHPGSLNPPTQPLVIPILGVDDAPLYRVIRTWNYHWEFEGRNFQLTVPRDFECDGASVPRLLWTLIGVTPDGLHRAAAMAHDYLYRYAGRVPLGQHHELVRDRWMRVDYPWSRKEADKLFARILRECGVGKVRRRLMYLGVRIGGGRSWKPYNTTIV